MVAADCGRGLYKQAFVNTTDDPPAAVIDEFAKALVASGGAGCVSSLHWHPLAFACPAPNLASLLMDKVLTSLMQTGGAHADAAIERTIDSVAKGESMRG
jgi:hypothetical protein